MAAIDTFIQFINDNWNKKLTIYKSSDLSGYFPGLSVNPNTYQSGNPIYGLPSDLFYDVATNTMYYRTTSSSNPWVKFGTSYTSSYSATPNVTIGKEIGHLPSSTKVSDLNNLSLSQILDLLFFKGYNPVKIDPITNYNILLNDGDDYPNIENEYFEVSERVDLKIHTFSDFGSWYINELNLHVSNYATGFNILLPEHSYFWFSDGVSLPPYEISKEDSIKVIEGENRFLVYANYKGINERRNNLNQLLTPATPKATFTSSQTNFKAIYGGYYTFVGISSNSNILNFEPRDLINDQFSKIYKPNEDINIKMSYGNKYMVVYLKGVFTDNDYQLFKTDKLYNIIEEVKFNTESNDVQVEIPNGSFVTYTKFVFQFIDNLKNDTYFKIRV